MGTTFSRTARSATEPGRYGDQLLVYDRPGEPMPALRCAEVKRFVQGGRATFWCPSCQPRRRQSAQTRAV